MEGSLKLFLNNKMNYVYDLISVYMTSCNLQCLFKK
jgi:hypothetical protein